MPREPSSVASPAELLVVDASAIVEALLGTDRGLRVRVRMRACELQAPAHLDAEVLSALGRLHRAGELNHATVSTALRELAVAPIRRHPLASLLLGAWERRSEYRLVDALYVELSVVLAPAAILTTDARLARTYTQAELLD